MTIHTDRERQLLEELRALDEEYRRTTKPLIDELTALRSMRPLPSGPIDRHVRRNYRRKGDIDETAI